MHIKIMKFKDGNFEGLFFLQKFTKWTGSVLGKSDP